MLLFVFLEDAKAFFFAYRVLHCHNKTHWYELNKRASTYSCSQTNHVLTVVRDLKITDTMAAVIINNS